MENIAIRVESPVGETAAGELTAGVAFCIEGWCFPEGSWRDFVSVVISWWEAAAFDLDQDGTAGMAFMDGPFEVRLTSVSNEEIRAEFVSRTAKGHKIERVAILQRNQFIGAVAAGFVAAARLFRSSGHVTAAGAAERAASRISRLSTGARDH